MKLNLLSFTLITLSGALLIGIFLSGNFSMFILSYIFLFVFMSFRSLYTAATLHIRLLRICIYVSVMVLQILYTCLITFSAGGGGAGFTMLKLTSTVIIFLPLIIEKLFFIKNNNTFFMPSIQDFAVVTYAQYVHDKDKIIAAANTARKAGKALSKDNLSKALDLAPEQSSFHYVSDRNISDEYFQVAYDNIEDEHIYIVLTDSGSPASEVISIFTKRQFNHVSLSFDRDLQTVVSYNGGQNVSLPGLNHEMIDCFNKKDDSSIMLYRLSATKEQKQKMIEKIKEINQEGSAYNLLGLIFKYSFRPNIMFCSQFVYQMLKHAGLEYFEKKCTEVRPHDLIELDYYRKLEYIDEVKFN